MLYTKDGYPEVNEIVLCEVIKIYGNTTFVKLKEYEKEGVLTISEIAPGRIRNLRDHVIEGKTIVCKVLRVDEKANRIDVSLRRVAVPVMRDKLEETKKEEFSEKVYVDVAKELGTNKDDLFEKTYEPIFEEYTTVFEALYDIMLNNEKISMFTNLSKDEQQTFLKGINDKIKPEEVTFKQEVDVKSLASDGVEQIKKSIESAVKPLNYDKIEVTYLAAGTFGVKIVHDDMRSASQVFSSFRKNLEEEAKTNKLLVSFEE